MMQIAKDTATSSVAMAIATVVALFGVWVFGAPVSADLVKSAISSWFNITLGFAAGMWVQKRNRERGS